MMHLRDDPFAGFASETTAPPSLFGNNSTEISPLSVCAIPVTWKPPRPFSGDGLSRQALQPASVKRKKTEDQMKSVNMGGPRIHEAKVRAV